jgi:hypothetical protein
MKSYSSALSASRTVPNRRGPLIPATAAIVMIVRRFVSILAKTGCTLPLLAQVEAPPLATSRAALRIHPAATRSPRRGGIDHNYIPPGDARQIRVASGLVVEAYRYASGVAHDLG